VFWSNWLVGSITTLALTLLFWPLISHDFARLNPKARPTTDGPSAA
jgi:hypothetical protein